MLVAFLPITLPFSAGLNFVKWAYNIYSRTYVFFLSTLSLGLRLIEPCFRPDVQRKFMAYIVDLTNVLDILFTLTSHKSQENLNIRTIKAALLAYYESMRRKHVHIHIRECSVAIFGSSGVVVEIELLLSNRYDIDKELVERIGKITPDRLEGEEAWYPSR